MKTIGRVQKVFQVFSCVQREGGGAAFFDCDLND